MTSTEIDMTDFLPEVLGIAAQNSQCLENGVECCDFFMSWLYAIAYLPAPQRVIEYK